MALTRFASALLASALAAGCNQSLFDANLGGDDPAGDGGNTDPDGGGGRDGGDDERDGAPPVRPDARVGDAGGVDGSEPMPSDCPAPCAGDAYADFDGTSDGTNGRWRYVEVDSAFDSVEMSSTTYPGSAGGWVGTGTPPPGIAYCPLSSDQLPCGDQASTLVFITSPNTTPTNPGLVWTAPLAGDYQVRVAWQFPSTAPRISNLWYLVYSDMQFEFSTDAMPGSFDRMITLAADDTVTLTALSKENTSTSLAVHFYITGPLSPAGFQGAQP